MGPKKGPLRIIIAGGDATRAGQVATLFGGLGHEVVTVVEDLP
jgi:hypothetical protein